MDQGEQRYATTGDWFFDKGTGDLIIRVTGGCAVSHDEAFLVALHELIEAKLCHNHGITAAAVDVFDFAFTGDGEPGDSPDAPYRKEHRFAMLVEHLMARELGVHDYGRVE